jgi:lipid A 3-O-deacylase
VILLRVRYSLLAALAVVLTVVLSLRPANSTDLAPAPAYSWPPATSAVSSTPPFDSYDIDANRYELRLGLFLHGVGSAEQGTGDLNPELVFPRLPFGQSNWWNILIPRPHVGAMLNVDGRTSSVYAGALWTFPLPQHFFAELFFDGEAQNGYLTDAPPGHSNLGCRYLFHDGGSLGYKVSQHWSMMFTFDHQSNGRAVFGTQCDGLPSTPNQGVNDYGLRLGYSF